MGRFYNSSILALQEAEGAQTRLPRWGGHSLLYSPCLRDRVQLWDLRLGGTRPNSVIFRRRPRGWEIHSDLVHPRDENSEVVETGRGNRLFSLCLRDGHVGAITLIQDSRGHTSSSKEADFSSVLLGLLGLCRRGFNRLQQLPDGVQ